MFWEDIDPTSSLDGVAEASLFDESTFVLLVEGASLRCLAGTKKRPPPGLEKAEYALRAPAAGRSRWDRTDIAGDEQRPSRCCSASSDSTHTLPVPCKTHVA